MNELLRAIPKVTELYDLPEVSDLREHYASSSVTEWIRTVLEQLRSAILSDEVTTLPTLEELGDRICRVAARESLPSLRPVINATGIVLHTNTMADLDHPAYDVETAWMREHGDEII